MINDEITQVVNGIDLTKPMRNTGLNQVRNIINALDNVLIQMHGSDSIFQARGEECLKMIEDIRASYFQFLNSAKSFQDEN